MLRPARLTALAVASLLLIQPAMVAAATAAPDDVAAAPDAAAVPAGAGAAGLVLHDAASRTIVVLPDPTTAGSADAPSPVVPLPGTADAARRESAALMARPAAAGSVGSATTLAPPAAGVAAPASALGPVAADPAAAAVAGSMYVLQVQSGASVVLPSTAPSIAPSVGATALVAQRAAEPAAALPSGAIYVLQVQPGASVVLPGASPATNPPSLVADGARPLSLAHVADAPALAGAPALVAPAYTGGLPVAGTGIAPPAAAGTPSGAAGSATPANVGGLPTAGGPSSAARLQPASGATNCGGLGYCAWSTQGPPASRCTSDARICTSVGSDPLTSSIVCSHRAQTGLHLCVEQGTPLLGGSTTAPLLSTTAALPAAAPAPAAFPSQ